MSKWWSRPPIEIDLHMQAWENFLADPTRADVMLAVRCHVEPIDVVLDAGCGGGHAMLPYLDTAAAVGVDMSGTALGLARRRLDEHKPTARLVLAAAAVEQLPVRAQSVDLVICRLVLQRVDVRRTLAEIARVLRPGGGLVVTFHHPRYYRRKIFDAVRARDLRPIVFAVRVCATGMWFQSTGVQRRILGMGETYLTGGSLRRHSKTFGMDFISEVPGGTPHTPSFLFRRRP